MMPDHAYATYSDVIQYQVKLSVTELIDAGMELIQVKCVF